jgi:hypothetical protein
MNILDRYWVDNPHQLEGAPRPLKAGERHCPYCEGYGYRPRRSDEPSGPKAVRCDWCDGTALTSPEGR